MLQALFLSLNSGRCFSMIFAKFRVSKERKVGRKAIPVLIIVGHFSMSVTFRLQTDDADYCQSRGQNLLTSSSSTLPIINRIPNMAMGKSGV